MRVVESVTHYDSSIVIKFDFDDKSLFSVSFPRYVKAEQTL